MKIDGNGASTGEGPAYSSEEVMALACIVSAKGPISINYKAFYTRNLRWNFEGEIIFFYLFLQGKYWFIHRVIRPHTGGVGVLPSLYGTQDHLPPVVSMRLSRFHVSGEISWSVFRFQGLVRTSVVFAYWLR